MQLELLQLTLAGLALVPLILLSILHLLDLQKSTGRERMTTIYGLLTFILLFIYFLVNWFTAYIELIVILFASAYTFLPVWIMSFSKSDYLEKWRIPFAVIFLVIWAAYVGTRLLAALYLSAYFLAIVFAISLIFLSFKLKEDKNTGILFLGLLLVYLERAWDFFDPISDTTFLVVGLWLVFHWYFQKRSRASS